MSHFTGLVCDKPGCHNTYQKPGGGESWWTRIAATEAGWITDDSGDYCSIGHSPVEYEDDNPDETFPPARKELVSS